MGENIKKYLTIDDLLSFCKSSKMDYFSANDAGGPIVIQSFGKIKTESTATAGLTSCTLHACHTELNRNKSFIEDDVMNNALASFANRPILGYIHQLEDGSWNFWDHRISVEEDDNDTRIEYLERPIGVIPESCNAHLEYDAEKNKNYVVVNGYIYDDYGNRAVEIIEENDGQVDVSVELAINAMSYNAKENYLNIEDFTFMGVTCLGKTPDGTTVMPGMEGSNLKLDNFSMKENSMFSNNVQAKMIEVLDKLNTTLSNFNNTTVQKGGCEMKFEELLAKYGITAEDVTFETEGLSDEELETAFKEAFESNDGEGADDNNSDGEEGSNDEGADDEGAGNEGSSTEGDDSESFEEKFTKTFSVELSHDDIRYALYNLISQYDEEDNEWYCIKSVYDNYFYMQGWCNNKIYKLGYSVDGENVSLEGERQEMFELIVSESEKLAIEKMREDYSALVEYKANVESEKLQAQKDIVFNDEKFASIAETKSFKQLVADSINYSVEECEQKANDILEDFKTFAVKADITKPHSVGLNFAAKQKKNKKAYGNLFAD